MMSKFLLPVFLMTGLAAHAQQSRQALTTRDYTRAEQFLSYNTSRYVDHGSVRPVWLQNDSFWFRDMTADGTGFYWQILLMVICRLLSTSKDWQKQSRRQPVQVVPLPCYRFTAFNIRKIERRLYSMPGISIGNVI